MPYHHHQPRAQPFALLNDSARGRWRGTFHSPWPPEFGALHNSPKAGQCRHKTGGVAWSQPRITFGLRLCSMGDLPIGKRVEGRDKASNRATAHICCPCLQSQGKPVGRAMKSATGPTRKTWNRPWPRGSTTKKHGLIMRWGHISCPISSSQSKVETKASDGRVATHMREERTMLCQVWSHDMTQVVSGSGLSATHFASKIAGTGPMRKPGSAGAPSPGGKRCRR